MKTCQSTGYFQRVYVRSLLCFISSVVFAGSAFAYDSVTNNINACYDCHGSPTIAAGGGNDIRPVDFAYRNITTGGFVGNHRTHMAVPTTNPLVCTPCHGPAPTKMDHRNGLINMRQHINSTASIRGYYNKPVGSPAVFFNQTSVPQLSTCNNVNCHFRTTTPLWGSAALTGGQTVANCQLCHQSTAMNSGNHTKHITYLGSTINSCATCHPNQTTFTHSTSAKAGRSITVTMAGSTFATSGTFAAGTHVAYPNYLNGTGTYGTCNTVYCHSSGQSTTGGTPPVYKAVTWNTTLTCSGCHGDSSATLLSGAHASHLGADSNCGNCHAGATQTAYNAATHVNNSIDVVSTLNYTAGGTPGNGYGSCSATVCHGSRTLTWSASTSNNTCTKCHGTPTATVTAANRYVVAPPNSISGVAGTVTGTGQVSNNPKVGAHQAHLQFLNGFSNYSTVDYRCQSCHGTLPVSGAHANGSSAPAFQGLATRGGMTPAWTAATVTCSNTYCHNPAGSGILNAGNVGTRTFVSWTSSSYLADSAKTEINCNRCHKSPGTVAGTILLSGTSTHSTVKISDSCSGCHGHDGDSAGTIGRRHMDGIKYGGGGAGGCIGCHGYGAGSWAAASSINAEGKGAHEIHITYLTAKRFTVTLNPLVDQYGIDTTGMGGTWTNVCGICHTGGTHMNGPVNVGIGAAYLFGTSGSPTYNGTPGQSSASIPKTCSNISCHYFTTPLWSTY